MLSYSQGMLYPPKDQATLFGELRACKDIDVPTVGEGEVGMRRCLS